MIIPIKEYIKLSKEERTSHLNLSVPCIERGGFSTKFCGVLAEGLGTTIPERKVDGVQVHLCHACNNPKCSNVKHLYWGTPKENHDDGIKCGHIKSPWENSVAKYGYEKALEIAQEQQRKICFIGGKSQRNKTPRRLK